MAEVTFNFKDDGLQQRLAWFIEAEPVPTDFNGTPLYTPAQWWKAWVIKNTRRAMQKGKQRLEETVIDEDAIK